MSYFTCNKKSSDPKMEPWDAGASEEENLSNWMQKKKLLQDK